MASKISSKIKNKVWKDYTKNAQSKNELKQMFLGINPTEAYQKISLKLKKKLDEAKTNASPKRTTLKPTKKPKKTLSPTRKPKRSISPSRAKKSSTKVGSPSKLKVKKSKSPSRVRLIKN